MKRVNKEEREGKKKAHAEGERKKIGSEEMKGKKRRELKNK